MGHGLFGDIRRVSRYEAIVSDIVRSGSVVVHKFARDRAAEIGAHRFLNAREVSPEAILADGGARTARVCRGQRIVVAQDTTEINFSGADRGRRGLGLAGDGRSLGFFIHALVAIDAIDEAVLGIVGAQIWTRSTTKVEARQKRHLKQKESHRWIDGVTTAGTVLAAAASIVVVGDRESDIYQVFTRRPANVDLIVRARSDRNLANGGRLYAAGAAFPIAHAMDIEVAPRQPRRAGDKGRIAHVAVSFGAVTINKPKTGLACDDPKQSALNMVVVHEVGPTPEGAKPIVWRLLTTLPLDTLADALDVIRLYRLRWRIEQVFRALKRDGLALEETQIESHTALFNLAALALSAAARILQLTDARDGSPRPATDVIDESLIEPADIIGQSLEGKTERQKNHFTCGSLAWLAWIAARLGGWKCYYKKPGPKTMADGWRRLADKLDGYALAQPKSLV